MGRMFKAFLGGLLALLGSGEGLALPASRPVAQPVLRDAGSYGKERSRMIEEQLVNRGIRDSLVLGAMRSVPRHLFVPEKLVPEAYADSPLPIGHEQTISQPYIVAFMTEALGLKGGEKVLEVGTGSGYQAAVLAEIVDDVYTIEIVEPLGLEAEERLKRLHYNNVHVRIGDGYRGWPEAAPFDAIIVTAAPDHIPRPLIDQLKVGGRLVVPVGDRNQELIQVTRTERGFDKKSILPVRFVPMTGEAREN
jgi:protein-L-isoaspartate(D-aspartate) O-methyltransferase